MNPANVLFVTHRKSQCGVYEFGENVFEAIRTSQKYKFIKAECESLAELESHIARSHPRAIIYNYMPATMPWVASNVFGRVLRNHVARIPVTQLGIIHSIMQPIADAAVPGKLLRRADPEVANRLFDYYIAPDPTHGPGRGRQHTDITRWVAANFVALKAGSTTVYDLSKPLK